MSTLSNVRSLQRAGRVVGLRQLCLLVVALFSAGASASTIIHAGQLVDVASGQSSH